MCAFAAIACGNSVSQIALSEVGKSNLRFSLSLSHTHTEGKIEIVHSHKSEQYLAPFPIY